MLTGAPGERNDDSTVTWCHTMTCSEGMVSVEHGGGGLAQTGPSVICVWTATIRPPSTSPSPHPGSGEGKKQLVF